MLSVVLYHFGVPGLGGGFVGVDIFFVISGFLIGGLLWKEQQETGRIRLLAFYLRRVRRLAPAFFAMAGVTAVFAALVFLPFEFREFGKELIAATVWLSNVLFYRGAGYFDAGDAAKALLHTWSLSVEEQFYLVLPVTLIALAVLKGRAVWVLAGLWALSFAASVVLTPTQPVAVFYLFPFRAWELLSGVLLAIWMRERGAPVVPGPLVWVALALVLVSVVLVRPEGFPGVQVAVPVLGTVILLAATDRGHPVLGLLSARGPVFVGLISYSLYLWHWPVLILSRYWRDGYSGAGEAALWLGLAVVLSVASWRYVERPVRESRRIGPRGLAGGFVVAAGVMLAFGGGAYVMNGMPGRFSDLARAHIAASQDFLQDWSRCETAADGPFAGVEVCAIGPEGAPEVLVWGDSHLRALMDGIGLSADEVGVPGLLIWHAGCPPFFDVVKVEGAATPAEDAACTEANARIEAALPGIGIDRVLLVGRWTYYAEGSGIGRDAENRIEVRAPDFVADGSPGAGFRYHLSDTVTRLNAMGMRVAVLRQVPEVPQYDSRAVARGLVHGRLSEAEAAALTFAVPEVLAARVAGSDVALASVAMTGQTEVIDPWPLLCPERCGVMKDGQSLYFDNNHLTNAGSYVLRDLFRPFLRGSSPPGSASQ